MTPLTTPLYADVVHGIDDLLGGRIQKLGMGVWIITLDDPRPYCVAGILGTGKQKNGRDEHTIFLKHPSNGELIPLTSLPGDQEFTILGRDVYYGDVREAFKLALTGWVVPSYSDAMAQLDAIWGDGSRPLGNQAHGVLRFIATVLGVDENMVPVSNPKAP